MNDSKKTTHPAGDEIAQPLEHKTTTARMFANYVLVPSRRLPNDGVRAQVLQGAALLVLPDQTQQIIPLLRGDSPHVAGQSAILPSTGTSQNVRDKIMSSHKTPKGNAMPELHCSACNAIVPAGAHHCPGCGLQLMAQATPAVHVEEPRFSLWKVLLIAAVVMIAVLEIFGSK